MILTTFVSFLFVYLFAFCGGVVFHRRIENLSSCDILYVSYAWEDMEKLRMILKMIFTDFSILLLPVY